MKKRSFASIKVKISASKKAKPIISRQKLVNRDKKVVVIVAALTAGVLTFSLLMGQRLVEIHHKNSLAISGSTTTSSGQSVVGLSEIDQRVDKNEEAEKRLRQGFESFNSQRDDKDWGRVDLACLDTCSPDDVVPVRTVLDALPNRYDHLVFRHQLQDFLTRQGFPPSNIELPQEASEEIGTDGGNWVEIPIEISMSVTASEVYELVEILDRSIRPMVIRNISVNKGSNQGQWSLQIAFTTYYQPATKLKFAKVVIPNQAQPAPANEES